MGMKALMHTLAACYGRQMNMQPQFSAILKKSLPADLTPEQGRTLGESLVRRCKFAPTVAEILEAWQSVKPRYQTARCPPPRTGRMDPAAIRRIRSIRQALQDGASLPPPAVTPALQEFARLFFPGISDETIRRNWLTIMNCKHDREKQLASGDPYWTVMTLLPDGCISLSMRRRI